MQVYCVRQRKMNKNNSYQSLLWTGGWDSTFQLLQTLFLYKNRVQSYYLIDPNRPSTLMEIKAIHNIRQAMGQSYPDLEKLILPLKFVMIEDIKIDSDIKKAFDEFKNEKHLGLQYLWAASFCKENGIQDMMLSIEKSATYDPQMWDNNLIDKLEPISLDGQDAFRIKNDYNNTKEHEIFKYFAFPLMEKTKMDMYKIAHENNWMDIMDLTWFCFYPTVKQKPCGVCTPCRQTISEGFKYRISFDKRVRCNITKNIKEPVANLIRPILITIGLIEST